MLDILKTKPLIVESAMKAKFNPGAALQLLIFVGILLVSQMTAGMIGGAIFIASQFESFMKIFENGMTIDSRILNSKIQALMNNPILVLVSLFCTVFVTLIVIVYCRFIERRSLYSMGFTKKKALMNYLYGSMIGFLMFGASVLIAYFTGSIEYRGFFLGGSAFMILLFLMGFFFQGMSEEVLMRGYLMISLTTKKTIIFAVIANSIIFAAFHLLNSGITVLSVVNLFLFGVFASLFTLKTNNIWGICAIHSVWNFTQGNIFGILVSGIQIKDSVFSFVPTETGALINGGKFGLEGGLAVTAVLVVSILLTVVLKSKPTELLMEST